MIVKIDYDKFTGTSLTIREGIKDIDAYVILRVTPENIVEAIEKHKDNGWVVGLEYGGQMPIDIDTKGMNVYFNYPVSVLDAATVYNIDTYCRRMPAGWKIVVTLPEGYPDMKVIQDLSTMYTNMAFAGATMLNIKGCKFGAVDNNCLPKPISEKKLPYIYEGDCCVLPVVLAEDTDYILGNSVCAKRGQNVVKERITNTKPKEKSTEKPQKKVTMGYASTSGLSGF